MIGWEMLQPAAEGPAFFFAIFGALVLVILLWSVLSDKEDNLRGFKAVFIIACALAIVGFFASAGEKPKAEQPAEQQAEEKEDDMKTLMVPIELTDAQMLALEKRANRSAVPGRSWTAQDEATMIASAAVTTATNDDLREVANVTPDEGRLTARKGVHNGPSGKESWYDLPMGGVVDIMRAQGFSKEEYPYWVREDGAKMLGAYVMIAADLNTRPRGTILDTSLGEGIVCDTGSFVNANPTQIDIATNWSH